MKTTHANPHRPFKRSRVAVLVCWLACVCAGAATPDAIAAGAEADEHRTAAEDGDELPPPPKLYTDAEAEVFAKRLEELDREDRASVRSVIQRLGIDRARIGPGRVRIGSATEWTDHQISRSYWIIESRSVVRINNVVIGKLYGPNPPIEARQPGHGTGEPPPIPPEPAAHADKPAAVTEADISGLVEELADPRKRNAAILALAKIGKPALPALIEALRGKDNRLHRPAAEALGEIGPDAVEATGALIGAIRDHDEQQLDMLRGPQLPYPSHATLFLAAEKALLKIGIHTPEAVPELIGLVDDEDYYIRMRAAMALKEIGPDAKAAVPVLIRQLQPKDGSTCQLAAEALGSIGPDAAEAAPALVEALSYASARPVGEALAKIGKPAVPWIKRALQDKESYVRVAAARTLGKIGPAAKGAVPELAAALRDKEARVRCSAADALGKIGPSARDAVAALVEALQDSETYVRAYAAGALRQIDPTNTEVAVAALIRALPSDSASIVLATIGPEAKDAVGKLMTTLSDKSPIRRKPAAVALGSIGPEAREAIPALTKTLQDEYVDIRTAAAVALVRIDPTTAPTAIPVLIESQEGRHQTFISDELARIGKPAVPALIRALDNRNSETWCWAALVLGRIGPEAKEAVPLLLGMLKDRHPTASAAARALGNMGPDAKRAVPELVKLLDNPSTRGEAAEALAQLDPAENEKHISIFIKALEGGDWWSRADAARALGRMGPAAEEAVPELEELLYDLDPSVRSAAAEALDKIRAAPALERMLPPAKSAPQVPERKNDTPEPPEHSEACDAKLNWQKAPDGAGEFLPAPNINQSGQFEHDGCRYVATPLGVLRWRPEGDWRIVPELYGRAISPIGMRDGLLWAVEGDHPTTLHPSRWLGHLAALDPADWSTKKKVKLPDRPSASIVAVEQDGFWCLEEPKTVIGGRASHYGQAVIANYSMDGQERFRFAVPPGKVAESLPEGLATSNPLIFWAAVDPDAVWLMVVDYQGCMPNDAPITGQSGFVRIDRATGKRVETPVQPNASVFNLPGRLLWLIRGSTPEPPYKSFYIVYQLDKQKMEVSKVGKVDAPPIGSIATDGKNLWFLGDETHVFSLEDLEPVPLEEAGPQPPGRPRVRHLTYPPLHILGGDGEWVWIIGPGSRISELGDDGSVAAWDLSKSSGYSLQAVARPGLLYFFSQGNLVRLRCGSPDVLSRAPFDSNPGCLDHLAAGDLLWIEHQSRAKILGPDLAEIASIEPVPGRFHCLQGGVPAGGSFYVFRRSPIRLERIDGKTGEVAVVGSWRKHAEKWCRANVEPNPSQTSLSILSFPVVPPVATPDGRVRFVFNAPAPPTRRSIQRYTMWLYDPATDRWEDSLLPTSFQPTLNPHLAQNIETKAILRCENNKWIPVGRLPEKWSKLMPAFGPMAATGRYLYVRTPLGLYRVDRTGIQATAARRDGGRPTGNTKHT